MSGTAVWIATTLVLAAAVHLIAVKVFPTALMGVVGKFGVKGPYNVLVHMPPTTARSRAVVRPSPDLLYSGCKYDLKDGPILVRAVVPDTYWSISFFAVNTDNYKVVNDRQVGSEPSFLLIRKGAAHTPPPGAVIVESPSRRGVILLRTLVNDPDALERLVALQKRATVTPL
jgi:uncharacterized membrane protein